VRDNLERFAASIAEGTVYPVSPAEIRANVQAFEAITRSAASGVVETIG
jgi:predicted dehydrogenase